MTVSLYKILSSSLLCLFLFVQCFGWLFSVFFSFAICNMLYTLRWKNRCSFQGEQKQEQTSLHNSFGCQFYSVEGQMYHTFFCFSSNSISLSLHRFLKLLFSFIFLAVVGVYFTLHACVCV